MNKLHIFIAIISGALLLGAGCPKKDTGTKIDGSWTCISIARLGPLGAVKPTADVDISKKMFGGNAGCNAYFSNLEVLEGGKISITGIGSTKMACPGERGSVETAYFDALQAATFFETKGGKLILSGDGGPVAVFSKN